MNIGIITIFKTPTNLGSFLQAYALNLFLKERGHNVYFIDYENNRQHMLSAILKINPKREFLIRFIRAYKTIRDCNKLNIISQKKAYNMNFDYIIYGSDEIWNMDNKYFKDKFFFGADRENTNKIAYAISVGEMAPETAEKNKDIIKGIYDFNNIFVRDSYTENLLKNITHKSYTTVCDPTLLVPLEKLTKPVKIPKDKYLLVYTYGIDEWLEKIIIRFAKEKNLKIISACFWNLWSEKIIQCTPLQFSSLIKNAEYVFTTTFHGAIFTMLNHKKCCIYPVRYKVRDVVERLGVSDRLIDEKCTYMEFCKKIEKDFPIETFKSKLKKYREDSVKVLEEALADGDKKNII